MNNGEPVSVARRWFAFKIATLPSDVVDKINETVLQIDTLARECYANDKSLSFTEHSCNYARMRAALSDADVPDFMADIPVSDANRKLIVDCLSVAIHMPEEKFMTLADFAIRTNPSLMKGIADMLAATNNVFGDIAWK